jgi:drug/metabolite transporter (DMT)-like permease
MFAGATVLAIASASQVPSRDAARGVVAALSAGVLWGTMYIPYRKAYLTGMSPLSFVTFFTVGELGMMSILAVTYSGGASALWSQLAGAKHVLFWLLAGGFIWVIGDLFQQYAVKYAGITRGIPLSNTNQLWGLLWGILVFGELRSASGSVLAQVIGGSIIMALGAGVIALSSVDRREHLRWQEAAEREGNRYGVRAEYTQARIAGEAGAIDATRRRSPLDWLVVGVATAIIIAFALVARAPQISIRPGWSLALIVATIGMLATAASALWRATRFN